MDVTYKSSVVSARFERKAWFKAVKSILRIFIKKPKFVFLGEKTLPGGIILSNHEGPKSPLSLELYSQVPFRMWGAHEMNTSMKTAYRYQTNIYYHQKQHWNLHLARLFCLIATPLTYMYYKGIHLISSYSDVRFKKTLKESLETLREGHTVVIFPEMSENGYLQELTGFHPGAVMFFQYCRQNGINVPVHVAYLHRKTRNYIFDAPTTVDDLLDLGLSRKELAQKLCDRCNQLGKMAL